MPVSSPMVMRSRFTMSAESLAHGPTSLTTCPQASSGFAMDGSASIASRLAMRVLTGDALSLFPFSVGQADYGAKVEVARG